MDKYHPVKIKDNTVLFYVFIFALSFLLCYVISEPLIGVILAILLALFSSTVLVFATIIYLKNFIRNDKSKVDKKIKGKFYDFPVMATFTSDTDKPSTLKPSDLSLMDFYTAMGAAIASMGIEMSDKIGTEKPDKSK